MAAVPGLPLSLIWITEDPHSGREKQVELTPAGERQFEAMMERGQRFSEQIVSPLALYMGKNQLSLIRPWRPSFHTNKKFLILQAHRWGCG